MRPPGDGAQGRAEAAAPATAQPLIAATGIVKGYRTGAGYVPVLRDLDLAVVEREMLAIVGTSGVGKSTLLHLLGALDRPEAGTIRVAGCDLLAMTPSRLPAFRNRTLGFVFQFHQLLPEFSAVENVMMPLQIGGASPSQAREVANGLLAEMGLSERGHHRPAALSAGEQQRVAVARALARSPRALLADEPSGNLDRETGDRLHGLIRRLNQERGITVVVVTHNERLAGTCDRTLRLDEGRLRPYAG